MEEFILGGKIIVHPVYNLDGIWIGSIECWNTEVREFEGFYTVDNRFARKFDIPSDLKFSSPHAIMSIINGG